MLTSLCVATFILLLGQHRRATYRLWLLRSSTVLVVSGSAAVRGLGFIAWMLCAAWRLTIYSVKGGTVTLSAFEVATRTTRAL